jgi:hypothetical protein
MTYLPPLPPYKPELCKVCVEVVEHIDGEWTHPHSGDTSCGTGDGAVATPGGTEAPHDLHNCECSTCDEDRAERGGFQRRRFG